MRNFLIIFFTFLYGSIFGQEEEVFEIGYKVESKKVTLITEDKGASIFLDGNFLGKNKQKAVLQSNKSNLCVVKFSNGKSSIEHLDLTKISDEYQLHETQLPEPKRQNKAYFDSLFFSVGYQLPADQHFGFNEQQELHWKSPANTSFTGHDREFMHDAVDLLNSLDIPSDYVGYDTAKFDHELVFRVNDILINIQDEFGYLHMQMTAQVYNKKGELIFAKDLLTFYAKETRAFNFKQSVKNCYEMGISFLTNDQGFISALKRKTPREHKIVKKIVVEKKDTVKKEPVVEAPKLNNGFPVSYFEGAARIKSTQGFFVGFIVADAGYVLTNGNLIPEGEETVYVKVFGQKTVRGKVLRRGSSTNAVLIQLVSNNEYSSLALAKENPAKNDTIYTVAPGKAYAYDKGVYQNEIAVDRNYYHTAIITPKKNSNGTPMLNSKGEVVGILNDAVRGKSSQKKEFFTPIQDALNDLNLKLE